VVKISASTTGDISQIEGPTTAPTTSVFHKGELIGGEVKGHKPLSTGTSRAAVEALDRAGEVHEFAIPKDVLAKWKYDWSSPRKVDTELRRA
jgi:hypothetical protein